MAGGCRMTSQWGLSVCICKSVLKNHVAFNSLHLCRTTPFHTASKKQKPFHLLKLLEDTKFSATGFYLKSFLYYVSAGISRAASRSFYFGFFFFLSPTGVSIFVLLHQMSKTFKTRPLSP